MCRGGRTSEGPRVGKRVGGEEIKSFPLSIEFPVACVNIVVIKQRSLYCSPHYSIHHLLPMATALHTAVNEDTAGVAGVSIL